MPCWQTPSKCHDDSYEGLVIGSQTLWKWSYQSIMSQRAFHSDYDTHQVEFSARLVISSSTKCLVWRRQLYFIHKNVCFYCANHQFSNYSFGIVCICTLHLCPLCYCGQLLNFEACFHAKVHFLAWRAIESQSALSYYTVHYKTKMLGEPQC